jgi:hypothetical protein
MYGARLKREFKFKGHEDVQEEAIETINMLVDAINNELSLSPISLIDARSLAHGANYHTIRAFMSRIDTFAGGLAYSKTKDLQRMKSDLLQDLALKTYSIQSLMSQIKKFMSELDDAEDKYKKGEYHLNLVYYGRM